MSGLDTVVGSLLTLRSWQLLLLSKLKLSQPGKTIADL